MRHGAKWPISHRKRIIELQAPEKDPTQILYHKDISAAIQFPESFEQDELSFPPSNILPGRQNNRQRQVLRPFSLILMA